MAEDSRAEQGKTFALGAGARTIGWIALAILGVVLAVHASIFSFLLLAGAAYSGFKAYQAKQEERAELINSAIQSSRSTGEAVVQQPVPEPTQQPAETKWQATVSKSSSATPGAGRGA